MKPQEEKAEFIKLRAEGKSYSFIAEPCTSVKAPAPAGNGNLKIR
jgi:hypothetical protein